MSRTSHFSNTHSRLTEHFDVYAIGLSSLCVVHCVALPVIAALLPFTAGLTDVHWIHQALVLVAMPATLWVIRSDPKPLFVVPAMAGMGLLLAAAFVETLAFHEVPVTVTGSLLLASAHLHHRTSSIRERRERTV